MNAWTGSGGYFPAGSGYLVNASYGVATATSTSTSPCYNVPLYSGGTVDPTVCIPQGTTPAAGTDGHLSVFDPIHNRVTDFWQAEYDSTTHEISGATAGSSFAPTSVDEHAPLSSGNCGWSGSNAACFPLRAGLLEPSDFTDPNGIQHPLVFSTPKIGCNATDGSTANCTGAGNDNFRYPADHNSQTCGTTCTDHMVEGTWLRMSPSVACASAAYGLTGWQQKICVALQKYGMFLRDNGGQVGIYADTRQNQGGSADWTAVGVPSGGPSLGHSFPWNQLQMLAAPSASGQTSSSSSSSSSSTSTTTTPTTPTTTSTTTTAPTTTSTTTTAPSTTTSSSTTTSTTTSDPPPPAGSVSENSVTAPSAESAATTISWTHRASSAGVTDGYMLVDIHETGTASPTSVTVAGTAAKLIGKATASGSSTQVYGAPVGTVASGAGIPVSITNNGALNMTAGSVLYANVNQAAPVATSVADNAMTTTPNTTTAVTARAGDAVVSAMTVQNLKAPAATKAAGTGTVTQRYSSTASSPIARGWGLADLADTASGPESVQFSWASSTSAHSAFTLVLAAG